MKGTIRRIALILPLLLSACVHKNSQAVNQPPLAPPIEDAPLPKPDNAPAHLPPPVISLPDNKKEVTPPPPAPQPEVPAPAPKHKKVANKSNSTPTQGPSQTTEQATSSVPAVGNLSSGDPADLKDQTQTMIVDTERGLNGITRKLNDQETKTSAQIREFLKQARTALTTNDVDGAHTLAKKANVLLSEITE